MNYVGGRFSNEILLRKCCQVRSRGSVGSEWY